VLAYGHVHEERLESEHLERLRRLEPLLDGVAVERAVRFGDVVEEVAREADAFDADLIAVSERRRPWWRPVLTRFVDRVRARAPHARADAVRSGAMIALLGGLVVLGVPVAGLVALLRWWTSCSADARRPWPGRSRSPTRSTASSRNRGADGAARAGRLACRAADGRPARRGARVVELVAVTLGPAVEVAVVAPWTPASRRPAAQSKERMASAMSA